MRRIRIPSLLLALLLLLAAAPATRAADPTPPGASTGSASAVTRTTATVAGTVDPNNGATTYVFEYGTSSSYGLTTPARDAGDGNGGVPASADLSGLTSATTYHYRVVATNAAGVTRGSDKTFTTQRSPRSPTIGTFTARNATSNGATVAGSVNPGGLDTQVRVEFGTKTSYGTATPAIVLPASFSSRPASLFVGGLQPYTTYHYRVVATNANGTTRGKDRTFKTLRAPTGLTLDPIVPAVDWKGSATISGRVSGAGLGSIGIAIERSDFPFSTTWTPRTLTTRSDGTFSTSIGPLYAATRVRVVTRAPYDVASSWATIANRLSVGLKTSNKTSTSVTLSGRVFPQSSAGVATLQRLASTGRWTRVARVDLTASGAFASRYTFAVKRPKSTRQFRVRVTPNDGGAHISGLSRTIAVRGRR